MVVALTPAVRAQEVPANVGLEAQQGPSGLPKNYEAYDLGELYVKGEKLPTSEQVTEETVITEEEIEATHSQNVADALSHVPGITVMTGAKNTPSISLQGLNQTETLILIDGVPYYETSYGFLNLNTIPVFMIDKIVVQKGVSSVLYGPNSMAGVINIITKKPTERPSLDAKAETGDYREFEGAISHGMKKGIFSYWFGYDHQQSDGWYLSHDFQPTTTIVEYRPGGNKAYVLQDGGVRNNSYFNMDSVWGKVGIEPTPGSEYYLNMHYITSNFGAPASLSNYFSPMVFPSPPAFSQLWTWPAYNNWGADLSGQQKVTDQLTFKGKLFYHNHVDVGDFFYDPDLTQEIARSTYKDNMEGGSLLGEYNVLPIDTLRAAFNYRRDDHQEQAAIGVPYLESVSYTGSVSVENQFDPIKPLSIVAGVAYDWWNVASEDLTEPSETPSANKVDPMVGATYTLPDTTKLFASWAGKERFPTLQQLYSSKGGNPDLLPEHSYNYVLGASRGITQYAKAETSFFVHDVSDMINRNSPVPTSPYLNYGKIFIWGAEATAQIFPAKDLSFGVGYTYTNATDESPNTPTSRVDYAPSSKVDLNAKYLIPVLKVQTDFTATYVGRMWDELPSASQPTTPSVRTGDYFIVGARISKVFYNHFEAYFVVQNLFDKNYEEQVGFPAPGRMLFAGVKYSY
jgi:outer membrane receptor protein involved in Fe transport